MERTVPSGLWGIGLATILVAGGGLFLFGWEMESDPSGRLLAAAILLACFCGLLGQQGSSRGSDDVGPILLLGGLGLGGVLGMEPFNRIFVIGLLAYAGFFLARHMAASLQKSLALVHVSLALMLAVLAIFMEEGRGVVGVLFLVLTFLPLVPFHLPFLGILRSSRESLGSVWLVVWLAAGLSQLQDLEAMLILHVEWKGVLPVLALVSALYASLKAMGHRLPRAGLAYATITFLALLWGLSGEFSHIAEWGLPFGMAVALLMSALLCAYAFLHERYGAHPLNTLQGLGAGLPRFRGIFTFLISLIMLLPVLPVVAAFKNIPPDAPEAHFLFPVWLLLFTVWLSVSWVFTTMLHQTAFGKPRSDVPHRDLSVYELWTLLLLMVTASMCGMMA
ncbi:MAG TPA: hypothetical protein PKM72_08545 [Nitrospirales bacterium]|nr:hypothetical protein [Nitrospirales bacterium]